MTLTSETAVSSQPAYVLHRKPFKEHQWLIDLFTPDYGLVSCVSQLKWRGGKSQRQVNQWLQAFTPLHVSWSGYRDLKSLDSFDVASAPIKLESHQLISGLYLNELVHRLLPRLDAQPLLFALYSSTLEQLSADSDIEPVLRHFEMQLLLELGYGVSFEQEQSSGAAIDPDAWYRFDSTQGFKRLASAGKSGQAGVFSGRVLLAIALDDFSHINARRTAKWVMRSALSSLLGNQELNSRKLFVRSPQG